jgi:hypothetical protein
MSDGAPLLSKNARKKQEKALYKQQMKREHHSWEHSAKLADARRLRARLNSDIAWAVPESALYAQLPRDSAQEFFAAVGDAVLRESVFFQRPQNCEPEDSAPDALVGSSDGSRAAAATTTTAGAATNADGDDSAQARACRIIDQFLWRAQKYNEKYASQELSLLYQIFRLGGTDGCDLVIDIGAGNANLSCLIALVFDVPVICVEMDSPRPELRGELWLPAHLKDRKAVTRVERLIQDYVLPERYKNVIVLGKHLCGPGTDAGIEFVHQYLDRMLGCVFATCCCCKLVGGPGAGKGGATLFADLYFAPDAPNSSQAGGGPCEPCEPQEGATAEVPPPPPPPVMGKNRLAGAEAGRKRAGAEAATGECSVIETEAARANEEALGRKETARALDRARLTAAKEEAKKVGKQLCRRFLRYGMCDDGEACRFYHCAEAPEAVAGDEQQDAGHALFRRYRFARAAGPGDEDGGGTAEDAGVAATANGAFLREVLPTVARATSWRNQVFNSQLRSTSAYEELLDEAEFFESWIQGFRRRRLKELFGSEEELLYCADDVHSQQNRCLVSGRVLKPYPSEASRSATYSAFLQLLEEQFLKHEVSLPMDLRVRGLVSAKFGYDGSSLPWDSAMEGT